MRAIARLMLGGVAAAMLVAAPVVTAPVVSAAIPAVVDPSIADGSPNSLRDVLESQITGGETVVLQAGATYVLDDCDLGDIDIGATVTIQGNGATIRQTCEDRVIDTDYDLTLIGVTITGGRTTDDGGGIQANGEDGQRITIIESTVVDNIGCSEGGGLEVEGAAVVSIIRSTFTRNGSISESAIDLDTGGSLLIVNSTISGNTASGHGAVYGEDGDGSGSITLVYSTVAGNIVGEPAFCEESVKAASAGEAEPEDRVRAAAPGDEPANIGLDGDDFALTTFGSVIALPVGGPNCTDVDAVDNLANTVSLGYNYSDDDSCDLDQFTDVQNGPDPKLGPLAANGGPTLTHLPQAGSPLINAIPLSACDDGDALVGSAVTTDQRGATRPQETGCEIGSVEIEAPPPVVIVPTFTG